MSLWSAQQLFSPVSCLWQWQEETRVNLVTTCHLPRLSPWEPKMVGGMLEGISLSSPVSICTWNCSPWIYLIPFWTWWYCLLPHLPVAPVLELHYPKNIRVYYSIKIYPWIVKKVYGKSILKTTSKELLWVSYKQQLVIHEPPFVQDTVMHYLLTRVSVRAQIHKLYRLTILYNSFPSLPLSFPPTAYPVQEHLSCWCDSWWAGRL